MVHSVLVLKSFRFITTQKAEKGQAVQEKEAVEEATNEETLRRLQNLGYSDSDAEQLLEQQKEEWWPQGRKSVDEVEPPTADSSRLPVYAKVKRKYISLETLKYYDVDWQMDEVSLAVW